MKKLLALLLAISMLLCFAACGESEDKDKDEAKEKQSSSQKDDNDEGSSQKGEDKDEDKDDNKDDDKGDENESTSQKTESVDAKKYGYAESVEEVVEHYESYFMGEVEYLKTLYPKEYVDYLDETQDESMDQIIERFKEELPKEFEAAKEYYGSDLEITAKLVNKVKCSEEEVKKIGEAMKESYSVIDAKKVTDAYNVVIKQSLKGSKKEDSQQAEMCAIKYDGYWYLIEYDAEDDVAYFANLT